MTTPEHDPIEVCVQCKSTLKPKFELDDIKSLKDEIDKFIASGTRCVRYILALNRSDFDGQIQKAVEEHRTQLPDAPNIEVWELAKIVNEAQEAVTRVIRKRVKQFNDDWREQLIGRFAPSGAWVRKVPARTYRMMLNWEDEPELRESVQTGEIDVRTLMLSSKTPHMGLLIGDDGIGKTSAALIISQADDKTVIYVPASAIEIKPGRGTNELTREIALAIDIQPPHEDDAKLFRFFVARALTAILREDPSVVLVIDGLDENRVLRGFYGLKLIRSQLKGVRCKVIVSTRTKHFNLRTGDFSSALQDKGRVGRRDKGIQVAELLPWTNDTVVKHIKDVASALSTKACEALSGLIEAIQNGTANNFYGTLLNHPIFLDLIIDDVVNDKVRRNTRSSLVRNWILRKIRRDQRKYQGTPLRGDLAQEARLIFRALEDVALEMSESESYVPLERISHTNVLRILTQHRLSDEEIFELLLKSVLVAVGQTTITRDANIAFSHRVFHEYMIASALVRKSLSPSDQTPSEIVSFFAELQKENS